MTLKTKYFIILVTIFSLIILGEFSYAKETTPARQIGIILDSTELSEVEQVEQETDTLINKNRIESAVWIPDQVKVTLDIEKTDQPVRLIIYNMLAKPVKTKDIDAGELFSNQEFTFENTSDLPQGHYFCVLIGTGFRDTKKFTIAR